MKDLGKTCKGRNNPNDDKTRSIAEKVPSPDMFNNPTSFYGKHGARKATTQVNTLISNRERVQLENKFGNDNMSAITIYNLLKKMPNVTNEEVLEVTAELARSHEFATKTDIEELRYETKSDIAEVTAKIEELRVKFDADMEKLRIKFDADMGELRAKFGADMGELRAKFDADMGELRAKFDADMGKLIAKSDVNIANLELRLIDRINTTARHTIMWMVSLNMVSLSILIAILSLLLK